MSHKPIQNAQASQKSTSDGERRPIGRFSPPAVLASAPTAALCLLHTTLIFLGMEGISGILGPNPIARDDHPLYFHSARVTSEFLGRSATTAGYDPSFMSGYAKSVVYPTSSTLPEVAIALFGENNPIVAYKIYVLIFASILPWLIALAAAIAGAGAFGSLVSVCLFLVYLWTDFPINYAAFGMIPYLASIPVAAIAIACVSRFLRRGSIRWWIVAAIACSFTLLTHATTAMIVVPATGLVYIKELLTQRFASRSSIGGAASRFGVSRHAGFWGLAAVAVAVNAFWWYPGLLLSETKGPSDFAFFHPEPVIGRLIKIAGSEPTIEIVLWAIGLKTFLYFTIKIIFSQIKKQHVELKAVESEIDRNRGSVFVLGWGGMFAAGFFWGYLAGASRAFDFLQPGRHTFACYTGLILAAGSAIGSIDRNLLDKLGAKGRFRIALAALIPIVAFAPFYKPLAASIKFRVFGREPFLSSNINPHLHTIVNALKKIVGPGDRVLYEEGGFGIPGVIDPYAGRRYSGLIPYYIPGVELIGGPYLHASLKTNFTQFGEGKLFGEARWGRDHFERYARLYRPSAIVCFSPRAIAFCRDNADWIEITAREGGIVIGKIRGFGGYAIRGKAEVFAKPGVIRVTNRSPELDGLTVLRYHLTPTLTATPRTELVPVYLEGDPVPFIGMRGREGRVELSLDLNPIVGR